MELNFKRYKLIIDKITPESIEAHIKGEEFDSAIDKLCSFLDDAPFDWYLVGGLGIDLFLGKQTRPHHDIDIEIPSDQAKDLIDYMASKGYSTYRRVEGRRLNILKALKNRSKKLFGKLNGVDVKIKPDTHYRWTFYEKASESDCIPSRKNKLCFFSENSSLNSYMPILDIFFVNQTESGTEIGIQGKSYYLHEPYEAEPVTWNGNMIKMRNPAYHTFLKSLLIKSDLTEDKHERDLELITEALAN